jgi:hypothetical protein
MAEASSRALTTAPWIAFGGVQELKSKKRRREHLTKFVIQKDLIMF